MGPTTRSLGLTMVINDLLTGMILQVLTLKLTAFAPKSGEMLEVIRIWKSSFLGSKAVSFQGSILF